MQPVYTIAILDFTFDEGNKRPEKYRYDVGIIEKETYDLFSEKLTFIYLAMPKFSKTLDQLETRFDKWLYVIRNLHQLDRIPDKLRERIFEKLFETAEIAKFDNQQRSAYEDSLKHYRDLKNSMDTAEEKGIEIGREEGIGIGREEGIEIGREEGVGVGIDLTIEVVVLAKSGHSSKEIAGQTNLPLQEVEKILKKLNQ